MSITNNLDIGNHLGELHKRLQEEFAEIGISIDTVNVEYMAQPILLDSTFPTREYIGDRPVIMQVHFKCDQDQFEYIRPIVSHAQTEHSYRVAPVHLHSPFSSAVPYAEDDIKIITIFSCRMDLHATGGDMEPFISEFRERTAKLRYKVESKKFDNEVEKMLREEDEYNN